ncbi:MAG: hypothetical protein GY839_14820, partial [candidate division Zixibacteria bacterium]|nr:hypothetical protein [candidate division Zixibacteria bacterium]
VALPANDECADAQVITEVTDYTFTTVGATTDGINNYANQNVWFCYTPATDGEVTIDMCDSDFDTRVAVYDGCDICADTLTNYLVGSDDDGCPTRTLMSLMTFSATGGQAYLIETGGYGANTGTIVMDITLVADPPGRCCYGDPYAPDCIDAITESECTTTYSGVFTVGLNCVDNPCDVLCPEDELMLILDTDSYGSETSWDVINHNDPADTIASGGPYASLSHFEEQICLGTADCIDVYIYDAYGDGGPDYDILLNDVSLFSGTIGGFGEAFMNIGNGCVTIVGACCDDVTGICVDDVAEDDCALGSRWTAETLCADIYPLCGVPLGVCCYDDGDLPACAINMETECDALGGAWLEGGTCDACPNCVDAVVDNGTPFDDYGSPASQYINDFPISAEGADDFIIPGTGLLAVDYITAWTTHWNGPANPALYDHVNVTIYADYVFGTPDTSWPAGYMGDDGVHVEFEAGGVIFTQDVTNFTFWQLTRPCTGDLWQINLEMEGLLLPANVKMWIVVQPDMAFSGVGQCAVALSDMNTGDAAKTNFPYLGTPAWTEFDGNAGVCDTIYAAGDLTDLAFCIHGEYVGSIAGMVTDDGARAPLADVLVEAVGTGVTDITDGSGIYNLEGIAPGLVDVLFTHADYRDLTVADVDVPAGDVAIVNAAMINAHTTIYDVQYATELGGDCYDSPYDGLDVIVTGVVAAVTQDADTLEPHHNYFIQDGNTGFNGVYVYDDTQVGMEVGDEVTLRGEVDEYYGLTEIKDVTSLVTNTTGNAVLEYELTDSDELWECDTLAAAGENLEGMLVSLVDVTVSSSASGGRYWLRTAGAIDSVELDDDLYKNGDGSDEPVFEVGATYDYIKGIVQYTYGTYELWPRGAADVADLGFAYVPGDCNMSNGLWPVTVVGGDVTYLVNYFIQMNDGCKIDGFFMSADVNGDCMVIGSDVTRMVNYFRQLGDIEYCADYEPLWPTPADCPVDPPDGWPNCDPPPPASTTVPVDLTK